MPDDVFIEEDCTVTHEGRSFTQGGAWLCDCTDGYRRGVVYARPHHDADGREVSGPHGGSVTDWHGNQVATASFGRLYQGNFCRMRAVSFTYGGVRFTGRYCPDGGNAVKVKSTKKVRKE